LREILEAAEVLSLFGTTESVHFSDAFLGRRLPAVTVYFLGALAKLQKETICFVISVCFSIRTHGTTRLPL
jgi:hypothetical protein